MEVRLFVVLDIIPNNENMRMEDIVITNISTYRPKKVEKVIYLEKWDDSDINEEIYVELNTFMKKLPTMFSGIENDIYIKIFQPIIHLIYQINNVIKQNKITEIVLIGGTKMQFMTLNDSEGEGIKKNYKTAWLCNEFLYQYYSDSKNIHISWINMENKWKMKIYFWLRSNKYFIREIIRLLYRKIFIKEDNYIYKPNEENKKIILAISNLPLQYRDLNKKTLYSKKYRTIFIINRHMKCEREGFIYRKNLDIISILKYTYQIKTSMRKRQASIILYGKEIRIELKNLLLGSLSVALFSYCERKSLEKTLKLFNKNDVRCVLTDMTVGNDITSVYKAAKEVGIEHINLQYVAMGNILYPNLELADKYFLYSNKNYSLYKKYSNKFKYFFPIEQYEIQEYTRNKLLRITLFTQPDMYTDRYLDALRIIIDELLNKKIKVELLLKLHYRQDKVDEFKNIIKRYSFSKIVQDTDVGTLIKNSDLIISMTSSVLFETITNRTPGIILNFDKKDEELIYKSDICFPNINKVVNDIETLINIFQNYDRFYQEYLKKSEAFLKKFSGGSNIDEWI